MEQNRNLLQDPDLYRFFEWKYPQEPMLERGGHTYPVVVYRAPEAQWEDPDSILSDVDVQPLSEKNPVIQDPSYRNFLEASGYPIKNLPLYTMTGFQQEGSLGLHCGLGSYFGMLDTCDALEWEIRSQWFTFRERQEKNFPELEACLPLRQKLHSCVADPVRNGTGRVAGLAVSTLIAFYDRQKLSLWLHRRSSRTSFLSEGMIHVFPSFMLQPMSCRLKEEFSVSYHFNREYLEELFNRPEPSGREGSMSFFNDDPCFQRLQRYRRQGDARLFLTGVAVNLLNLRPEICILLLIRNPEWFEYHASKAPEEERFCGNEEFQEFDRKREEHSLFGFRIPYAGRDEDLLKGGDLYPDRVVPPGAAAFWLGIDMIRCFM